MDGDKYYKFPHKFCDISLLPNHVSVPCVQVHQVTRLGCHLVGTAIKSGINELSGPLNNSKSPDLQMLDVFLCTLRS